MKRTEANVRLIFTLSLLLIAGLHLGTAGANALKSCEALMALTIPHGTVDSAEVINRAKIQELKRASQPIVVSTPMCRVRGVSRPTLNSEIRFEVWIPLGSQWNGKYLQVGNGGFGGVIQYGDLDSGLRRGYAVAATDDGHQSDSGSDASWALGQPEKIRDYGYRAVKETYDAALTILTAYSGSAPKVTYFAGCSDGGREALQVVQKYPDDFQGVIAGSPSNYLTSLLGQGGLLAQRMDDPKARLTSKELNELQTAARSKCNSSAGYIDNPIDCGFTPDILACHQHSARDCLTPAQLATAHAIYDGPRQTQNDTRWPGLQPGAEAMDLSWSDWITGYDIDHNVYPLAEQFARSYFAYMVLQKPSFTLRDLTYADIDEGAARLGQFLDASEPDISAFRRRGGKLIQYHGWNDPAIPPGYSIRYYESVKKEIGDPSEFYRLFMVPGMLHCSGGPGPYAINWLSYLEDWVERGKGPDSVLASRPAATHNGSSQSGQKRLYPFTGRSSSGTLSNTVPF